MDEDELTPGQLAVYAQGQVNMIKFVKLIAAFLVILLSFNAYTGYGATKLGDKYVTSKKYEEDKKEAKEARKEDRKDIKEILKSVQDIKLDMSYIKGADSAKEPGKKKGD